jgi:hypothetical protein
MEKFALTNPINTNKPKRPSSLANDIRQCPAWKRRDARHCPGGRHPERVRCLEHRMRRRCTDTTFGRADFDPLRTPR